MTDLRKAAQQALEALETCDAAHLSDGGTQWYDDKAVSDAITALRAALAQPDVPEAQPAQAGAEPLSWVVLQKTADEIVRSKSLWKRFIDGTPLENDIACWMADFAQQFQAHPPARVPLTENEISEIAERMEALDPTDSFWREFANAAIAAYEAKTA